MKTKKRLEFTLIELLVVIAIISILMSLLLPGLSKAKEMGRRSLCSGNMKQIYLGAINYAMDYNSTLPRSSIYTYTSLGVHSSDSSMENEPSGSGKTGWFLMDEAKSFNRNILACPSSDRDFIKDAGYRRINYSYRYNTGAVENLNTPYLPFGNNILDKGTSKNALFSEAAGYRRYNGSGGKDVSPVIYNLSEDYNKLKWSHRQGGNIAAFDGHVLWLKNQIHPSASTHATYNSWPTINAAIRYRITDGLDYYLKDL